MSEHKKKMVLVGFLFLLSSVVFTVVGIVTANYDVLYGVSLQFLGGITLVINNIN